MLPTSSHSTSVIRKLLSSLRLWPTTEVTKKSTNEIAKPIGKQTVTRKRRFQDLHELYKPFDICDNNHVNRLNETIELFEKFQRAAMNYVLDINELAKEYLLKGRYREDKENFLNSFGVEPCHLMLSELWQYSKNY